MPKSNRYIVWSPDLIPIEDTTYKSRAAAERARKAFVERFVIQGYYRSAACEAIALEDLEERCRIEEISP